MKARSHFRFHPRIPVEDDVDLPPPVHAHDVRLDGVVPDAPHLRAVQTAVRSVVEVCHDVVLHELVCGRRVRAKIANEHERRFACDGWRFSVDERRFAVDGYRFTVGWRRSNFLATRQHRSPERLPGVALLYFGLHL